jgi:hypothetical protein
MSETPLRVVEQLRGCDRGQKEETKFQLGGGFSLWQTLDMISTLSASTPRERTGDEVSAERYRLMADKIEADPALLEIPLANIARWLAQGHSAVKRLEGWRSMIREAQVSHEGMEKLLFILRDEEWESMMWKGFSPFPGILTKDELKRLSWSSRH